MQLPVAEKDNCRISAYTLRRKSRNIPEKKHPGIGYACVRGASRLVVFASLIQTQGITV